MRHEKKIKLGFELHHHLNPLASSLRYEFHIKVSVVGVLLLRYGILYEFHIKFHL